MKEFFTRTLSGVVFVVVLVISIFWSKWSFAGLFLVFSMLGLNEFLKLRNHDSGSGIPAFTIYLFAATTYITLGLAAMQFISYKYLFVLPFTTILIWLEVLISGKNKTPQGAINGMGGVLYVVLPFVLLNFIANQGMQKDVYSPWLLMGFFILMWSNDVFAYVSGSLLGKHPLYKSVSPKKSWEGFVGGLILTILAAYPVYLLFGELNLIHWVFIALIIVIFGTLGDLTESLLKRQAGLKDSGKIMPGHGGVLDRFDGVLFSAPAVLLYLIIFIK